MGAATVRRALLILAAATAALAADRQILGRRLVVKNVTGVEARRVVIVQGRQTSSTFQLLEDPTASGASLQVVANGASGSTQVLTLDAAGWSAISDGFAYEGPTTGDPVRRLFIKRTNGGTSVLKAVLRGDVGTADLVIAPPNPGDDGGLVLGFPGGDRYCVSFGGAAGGAETKDDAQRWMVVSATATSSCPVSPSITTTTTSTTMPPCVFEGPACNGSCPAGYTCESAGGGCYCFTGSSDQCQTCDPPCSGSDVCTAALAFGPAQGQIRVACGCATPPLCGNLQCAANCPAGSFCVPGVSMTACICRFSP